ncbi:hypothetical protein ABT272_42825 [Streptomyces sp900105245]|uniref:Transposase n=1 Tax=Streptomyces sp. 900105245 TaxID=3154379 RepID=A0ABV1UKT3_9ACTN
MERQALCGILFVLHAGIQWEYLPQDLGLGSRVPCWRGLAAWNEPSVRDAFHLVLLKKLRAAKKLGWSRAVIDTPNGQAKRYRLLMHLERHERVLESAKQYRDLASCRNRDTGPEFFALAALVA